MNTQLTKTFSLAKSDKSENCVQTVNKSEKLLVSCLNRNSTEIEQGRERSLEQRVIYQARELNALRHVLERLRGAVIHCDAQNAQMQVTLQKHRRQKQNRDSKSFDQKASTVEDLENTRELLICALVKVKELESKVKTESLQADCSPFTVNENSAPTDVVNEKETVSKLAVTDKKDYSNYQHQMDMMKKRWREAEKEWDEERLSLLDELNIRQMDCEEQETELRLLEAERVRLATQEGKLKDALRLLRNLKLLNFPRRTLGKILIDSLAGCRDQNKSERHVNNFLDLFYQNLLSCEVNHNNSLVPLALQIGTQPDQN